MLFDLISRDIPTSLQSKLSSLPMDNGVFPVRSKPFAGFNNKVAVWNVRGYEKYELYRRDFSQTNFLIWWKC